MNIFNVVDGKLIHAKKETVNTGSKQFFKIEIRFNNSWSEYTKLRFVEFYQNIDGQHYKVNIGNSNIEIADIPTVVLKSDLPIYVGVVAENDNSEILANTNFLPIPIEYGAGTQESIFVENGKDDLFQLFAPDTSLRYLRIRNNLLEYSNNNKDWFKSSIGNIDLNNYDTKEEADAKNAEILEEAKRYTDNEIATFDFVKIVDELPKEGLPNREYFLRKTDTTDQTDLFDEWAWINKGTEVEPNYGWEFKGTKKVEVDLTDYVKKTDYAVNGGSHGLVKINQAFGIGLPNGKNEPIATIYAEPDDINNGTNQYRPIMSLNFDYAFKRAFTDFKGDKGNGSAPIKFKTTWTEEDKAKARELIGAVGKGEAGGGSADLDNYYTKEEFDNLLAQFGLNHYTKEEVYNKEEIDDMLEGGNMANLENYYTKTEINNMLLSSVLKEYKYDVFLNAEYEDAELFNIYLDYSSAYIELIKNFPFLNMIDLSLAYPLLFAFTTMLEIEFTIKHNSKEYVVPVIAKMTIYEQLKNIDFCIYNGSLIVGDFVGDFIVKLVGLKYTVRNGNFCLLSVPLVVNKELVSGDDGFVEKVSVVGGALYDLSVKKVMASIDIQKALEYLEQLGQEEI